MQDNLRERVYQAIGEASTCWSDLNNAGVYNDVAAAKIAEDLLTFICQQPTSNQHACNTPPKRPEPNPPHQIPKSL